VNPVLASLIALQALDSAADLARRRLSELPAAEKAIDASLAAAAGAADATKQEIQEANEARRALEKEVAQVDSRLSRFDDHRAAVKTNQEYTALLHEIAAAKTEKGALEERILVLMEQIEAQGQTLKDQTAALADTRRAGEKERAVLVAERTSLDATLADLIRQRTRETAGIDKAVLHRYEQLLKQRRGQAVAAMIGEVCTACHVRLRPAVAQQVRRNDELVQCDSCQRLLYVAAKADA
jgi:predicted  nucleic acid-binding Zn-ribbon protein